MRSVVVVGFGGHASDVAAALLDMDDVRLVGFAGDQPPISPASARLGVPYIGPVEDVGGRADWSVVAVGDPRMRRVLAARATAAGLAPTTLVHPRAYVGAGVELGAGCVLLANACISSTASLGRHVHLNVGASVSHDAAIGDHVTLNPGARVTGCVELGDDVTIGAGAVVLERMAVGRGSYVGAGSVVTHDVPADVVAYGAPARVRRGVERGVTC